MALNGVFSASPHGAILTLGLAMLVPMEHEPKNPRRLQTRIKTILGTLAATVAVANELGDLIGKLVNLVHK